MSALLVEDPGLLTTIQDMGRSGHYASGVPVGGAMDRFALAAANLLVGNQPGAPALECTLGGPTLVARRSCLVAVAGADLGPCRNERPVPGWAGFFLAAGDRLSFAGRRSGARAYVAVAGGISGQRWLGSASTYLLVGRGGIHGRSLKAGDELELAADPPRPVVAGRRLLPADRPPYSEQPELRLVPGPHAGRLRPRDRRALLGTPWQVSRDADRMGYRLEGPPLEIAIPGLISFGLAPGCVQVPPSGQPIVLMADHQTAGGYPVLGAVARADMPLLAQVLPGDHVRFRRVTLEEAQAAWTALRETLGTIAEGR